MMSTTKMSGRARGKREREPKVWCDEDTKDAKPGDFYVDCQGTWIFDPDMSMRGYHDLTAAERMLCHTIIRAERAEEALQPFAKAATDHGMKWEPNKPDLWVSLGLPRSAWLRAVSQLEQFELYRPSTELPGAVSESQEKP